MQDKIEDHLEKLSLALKQAKPTLKDPSRLTDSIMEQIGIQNKRKVTPMLIWVRATLSTAAALLLGLFVFQQTEAEKTTANASVKFVIENTIETDSTCMQMLGNEHLSMFKTYLCYMQQNAIDNKEFKTHPLKKN